MSFLGNDIRSSEKTFQLMNQLSGRAGREVKNSTVYLQTFEPENQTLKSMSMFSFRSQSTPSTSNTYPIIIRTYPLCRWEL